MKTFRNYALRTLEDFFQDPGKLSEIFSMQMAQESVSQQTRNEIQEMLFGTVRLHQILEEIVLERMERKPPVRIQYLLELALYELLEMDGVPDYATVNSWVDIAKEINPKYGGLVNAIMKYFIKNRDAIKVQFESGKKKNLPAWVKDRLSFGTDKIAEFSMYLSDRPITDVIVYGELTDSVEFLKDSDINLENHKVVTNLSALLKTKDFQNGNVSIMDRASQLVAKYGFDKNSTSVIDLCAAPGGKLAFWVKNNPNLQFVLAIDKNSRKIDQMTQTFDRLSIKDKIQTGAGDATKVKFDKVDVVLVDAPCSGSGVLNRKPDIRTNQTSDNLKLLQKLQLDLLENASNMVKIGGKIVYSTCSFLDTENETVVERFLRKHQEFHYDLNPDPYFNSYQTKTGFRTFPNNTNMDGACTFILRRVE